MLQLTPNAVPYTYIVSKRSTVTAFSYAKAYVEKMTLPKFRSVSTYSLYLNKPRLLNTTLYIHVHVHVQRFKVIRFSLLEKTFEIFFSIIRA